MPAVVIQKILGHTSLRTTELYIRGAGPRIQQWANQMALPVPEKATPEVPAVQPADLPARRAPLQDRRSRRTARHPSMRYPPS